MGRATGICGGFGGSMHIADPALGIFGANGIVGAGLPIAVGAAFAAALRDRTGVVAVAFFGDGAVSTGAFHEAVNLAGAVAAARSCSSARTTGSPSSAATADQHPVALSSAPGLRARLRDRSTGTTSRPSRGRHAVWSRSCGRAVPPVLLEAVTFRVRGHYEGDPQRYRDARGQRSRRPDSTQSRAALAGAGRPGRSMVRHRRGGERRGRRSRRGRARGPAARPRPRQLGDVRRTSAAARSPPLPRRRPRRTGRASRLLRRALDDALADDHAGLPRRHRRGAAATCSASPEGWRTKYPGRVLDTPISETAIMGLGVGRRHGRPAPGRRADVPGLPRRVPGPDA